MYDVKLYLRCRKLDERVAQSFNRAVDITLDNNIQFLEVANGNTSSDLIEGNMFLSPQTLFPLQLGPFCCNFLGFAVAFHNVEFVTGLRSSVKTKNDCRGGRPYSIDFCAPFIVHCLYVSVTCAGNHYVTNVQCSCLYKDSRSKATALVKS